MIDLLKSFSEKHALIFNAITIGIPSTLLFVLFMILDPIGFKTLELANRVVVYIMLGMLCFFVGLLVGGFFKWLLSRSS